VAPVTSTDVSHRQAGGAGGVGGTVYRAVAAELAAIRERAPGRAPQVLDVGGGSGAWAVPLATAGCAVSVVDPSPNALAALRRRARDAGVEELVTAVTGEVERLAEVAPLGRADLVLGHGLLEVVDDPHAAVRALAGAAAPGGVVSLLVAGLRRALAAAPELRLELLRGDGVVECWVPGTSREREGGGASAALGELEELAAAEPALIDVAARLHAVARRVG
jgi:SAM-dependent methyltransferase